MDTATTYQLGIWAQRRLRYLKEHRRVHYTNLLTSDVLDAHLQEADERAEEWMWRLPSEIAKREGITEVMKAVDPLAWAQAMNNVYAKVREIIENDIIFA